MTEWYIEKSDLNPGFGVALTKEKILFKQKSTYQDVEVFSNKLFGNVMLLDDVVMVTEKDEYAYHEMLIHVPLCVNPTTENVLVIGGGDGGAVRELTKYNTIKKIDLIEIDPMVCEVAKKFFPDVSSALNHEKVNILHKDGVEYVQEQEENTYDLIIIDSTDPVSIGEGLFTQAFYQDCKRILKKEGILVNQSENPFVGMSMVTDVHQKLSTVFSHFHFFQSVVPTYPGGLWLFGFASQQVHPINDMKKNWKQLNIETKYYTPELHKASFVLPKFIQEKISS